MSGSLDSYNCSLKPLCSGMGEVVPARTSPTLLPHPLALCCHYPVSKCCSASIAVTGTLRVNERRVPKTCKNKPVYCCFQVNNGHFACTHCMSYEIFFTLQPRNPLIIGRSIAWFISIWVLMSFHTVDTSSYRLHTKQFYLHYRVRVSLTSPRTLHEFSQSGSDFIRRMEYASRNGAQKYI